MASLLLVGVNIAGEESPLTGEVAPFAGLFLLGLMIPFLMLLIP
jgi:hypothetical protein